MDKVDLFVLLNKHIDVLIFMLTYMEGLDIFFNKRFLVKLKKKHKKIVVFTHARS